MSPLINRDANQTSTAGRHVIIGSQLQPISGAYEPNLTHTDFSLPVNHKTIAMIPDIVRFVYVVSGH